MGSCLSTSSRQREPSASDSAASTYSPQAEDLTPPLRKTNNTPAAKGNIHISLGNDDDNFHRSNTGTSNGTSVNASTHPLPIQNKDDRQGVASLKRRALLIGITYTGPHNKWTPLDGPHSDVDRYRDLLTSA